jgi:peptide/nickel transport system permease protein
VNKPLRKKAIFFAGLFLIGVMVVFALLAPWIAPFDPNLMSLQERYASPSWQHPFGLDQNGGDVFSQILYGARVSLYVALTVISLSVAVGLVIGSLAGFKGGWVDMVIMRVIDMIYSFPGFLLALSLVAVLGPSVNNLIIAMSLTSWTAYARLVRAEVLHLKSRDFVLGATALGAPPLRVMVIHIWPNLVGPLIVQATFGMAGTIITETGLSFLGLGAPPSVPTWGALLNAGRRVLIEAPHVSLFPGLAILLLVLGFNLVGDGLRDWLDPKKA